MATGTWTVYGPAVAAAFNGSLDLDDNPNLVMIFTGASHTPDEDHEFQDDLTNIISGTNLSADGVAITGTFAYNATTDTSTFDVSNVSESNVTATGIKNAHIVDQTGGSAATNRLVAFTTFDDTLSPSNGNLTVTIDSAGVFDIAKAS